MFTISPITFTSFPIKVSYFLTCFLQSEEVKHLLKSKLFEMEKSRLTISFNASKAAIRSPANGPKSGRFVTMFSLFMFSYLVIALALLGRK